MGQKDLVFAHHLALASRPCTAETATDCLLKKSFCIIVAPSFGKKEVNEIQKNYMGAISYNLWGFQNCLKIQIIKW